MSKMKELYEKVSKDDALQAKLFEILSNAESLGEDAVKEKLIQFAKAQGYDITIEEMQVYFNDLAEKDQNELSAADLDMVAGGKASIYTLGYQISLGTAGLGCAILSLDMLLIKVSDPNAKSCSDTLSMDVRK